MGVELDYGDKVRIIGALEKIKQVAEAQRDTRRAIEQHTTKLEEAILQLTCWVAGLTVVALVGIAAFIIWATLN